ncbi:MAG: ABC transporter substrate-binding protein [Firmicutes bacterium]|nr:ABC transporter substrate-binding protein [Bacillota bacterium]
MTFSVRGNKILRFGVLTILAFSIPVLIWGGFRSGRMVKELPILGVLLSGPVREAKMAGLIQSLREMGLGQGKDYRLVVKYAGDSLGGLKDAAQELVDLNPRVLVAGGGVEADALQAVTGRIPIVFMGVASSQQRGLVASYRYPGGNVTGVDNYHTELAGKRLEFISRILPGVKRVLVLYDPRVTPGTSSLKVMEEAANRLGIRAETLAVTETGSLPGLLTERARGRYDAILPLSSFFMEALGERLVDISQQLGIPLMGLTEEDARMGYLASYGVSYTNQGRQAARLVYKIWHGQDPSSVPVESPDSIDLVINLAVAKKLHRAIPLQVLGYASRVIPGP